MCRVGVGLVGGHAHLSSTSSVSRSSLPSVVFRMETSLVLMGSSSGRLLNRKVTVGGAIGSIESHCRMLVTLSLSEYPQRSAFRR